MHSSGETAIATSTNAAVTLIAAVASVQIGHVTILNGSAVAGFFSIDGGRTWCRLAASSTVNLDFAEKPRPLLNIQVKRIADGSDVTALFAYAW